MDIQTLLYPIKNKLAQTEKIIQKNFTEELKIIHKIKQYTIDNKGKRLRPAILILSSYCFIEESKIKNNIQAPKVASIIEYIHTASLIHDDVVDKSDCRRHQKTAHTIWGNKTTILVGDYILAKALEQLANLENTDLVKIITKAVMAIAKGEILQLLHRIENNSAKKYLEIIRLKTAALLAGTMQAGGLLAGQGQKAQEMLFSCGENLGMAFQITDDILDYQGEKTGKIIGKDFEEKKITLPLCKLLYSANTLEKKKIIKIFSTKVSSKNDLQEILSLMQKNNVFQKCFQDAKQYTKKAKKIILHLPDSPYQKTLLSLADFIVQRLH